MSPDFSESVSLGNEGDIVISISSALKRQGLLEDSTSHFTSEVEEAIKAFQQSRGLTVSGVVDLTTWKSLDEAKWKLGDRILKNNFQQEYIITCNFLRC